MSWNAAFNRWNESLWSSPMTSIAMSHRPILFRWYAMSRVVYRERSEEHTSELQSPMYLVCRHLLEKKKACTTRRLRSRTSGRPEAGSETHAERASDHLADRNGGAPTLVAASCGLPVGSQPLWQKRL